MHQAQLGIRQAGEGVITLQDRKGNEKKGVKRPLFYYQESLCCSELSSIFISLLRVLVAIPSTRPIIRRFYLGKKQKKAD